MGGLARGVDTTRSRINMAAPLAKNNECTCALVPSMVRMRIARNGQGRRSVGTGDGVQSDPATRANVERTGKLRQAQAGTRKAHARHKYARGRACKTKIDARCRGRRGYMRRAMVENEP